MARAAHLGFASGAHAGHQVGSLPHTTPVCLVVPAQMAELERFSSESQNFTYQHCDPQQVT